MPKRQAPKDVDWAKVFRNDAREFPPQQALQTLHKHRQRSLEQMLTMRIQKRHLLVNLKKGVTGVSESAAPLSSIICETILFKSLVHTFSAMLT